MEVRTSVRVENCADLSAQRLLIAWPETVVAPDHPPVTIEQIVGRCRLHAKLPGDGTFDVEARGNREAIPVVEFPRAHDIVGDIDRHDVETAGGEFLVDLLQVRKLLTARQSRWRPEVHQCDRRPWIEAGVFLQQSWNAESRWTRRNCGEP